MDIKSVIALLGGMILMFFLIEVVEPPTVALLAAQRPADMESYLAARNEPGVIPGRLAIYGIVGILAGDKLPTRVPQHPDCANAGGEILDERGEVPDHRRVVEIAPLRDQHHVEVMLHE